MTAAEAARSLHRDGQAAVCDRVEPWEHGTILRASRYPDLLRYNTVRADRGLESLEAGALMAFAEEALRDDASLRVDVEDEDAARRMRPEFQAAGWLGELLVWMRLGDSPPSAGADPRVELVEPGVVRVLRVEWYDEDFPGWDSTRFVDQGERLARDRGSRVLALFDGGRPAGYAQVDPVGDRAEVSQVFVTRSQRGRGIGAALTRAAIESAADARETWIVAEADGRPRELYARLGFRPAWIAGQFLRLA